MPSAAYTNSLDALLNDAEELLQAHGKSKTGKAGRQWGLGGLNRACVVMCVSAWEAYVESLIRESLSKMRPAATSNIVWPILTHPAERELGRFHTPNPDQVRFLFSTCIGLDDVTVNWYWQKCSQKQAVQYLKDILKLRHEIAHGVNPRPSVDFGYAEWLLPFFRRLGEKTDATVKDYLVTTLGLPSPW
ncbi:MAG TPA: HEPN domain-containing protein [Verrucomicrobiae bacterium]|jgi:hypothetical protein|nr:HEPN domain-containing protein [Verrucomicrobiae bacterium]